MSNSSSSNSGGKGDGSDEAGKGRGGKRRRQRKLVKGKPNDNQSSPTQQPAPPAVGDQPTAQPPPLPQPKAKRQLTPAQLEARRKGGKARGAQLKNDPAHQSRAARASHQSQGREKMAERGRRNRLKALERYPDLYERAGEGALKGMAAKKERERLERERLAQQQHDGEQGNQPDQAGHPVEPSEQKPAEDEGNQ